MPDPPRPDYVADRDGSEVRSIPIQGHTARSPRDLVVQALGGVPVVAKGWPACGKQQDCPSEGAYGRSPDAKDFDVAYVPWYTARLLMGIILGLIFYCMIKGGLLLVMVDSKPSDELNQWSLAGIGALVGLFSKNATDKLRELFDTLLRTAPVDEPGLLIRISRFAAEERKKMMEVLPAPVADALLADDQKELERVCLELDDASKADLRSKLPGSALVLLGKFI